MKLLIDIPEHIYEHAKESSEDSRDEFDAMRAIANGTQQESRSENPNTCGDAVSRAELIEALDTWDKFGYAPTNELIPLRGNVDKDKYVPYIHYDDVIECIKGMPSVTKQPCDDAISRQAVLDEIDRRFDLAKPFKQLIESMPSVTPQQRMGRWIPVSERLPDDRKKCLVTFRGGYVGIMCYASDLYGVDEYDFCDEKGKAGWYDYDRELGHYSRDDVIAWLPLPTPYKAEREVDS